MTGRTGGLGRGVTVECPAKINLFLRFLARESTGYHQIETLFQAVGLFDRVDVFPGPAGVDLEVRAGADALGFVDAAAETGDARDNTAVRAAEAFHARLGTPPAVRIALVKSIPAGAGLGGGSSDAAGALLALNELHGRPLGRRSLIELAGSVGADAPFFCAGAPAALAWGRGDRLAPAPSPPARPVVLAAPRARMSTAQAYAEASAAVETPAPAALLRGWNSGDWSVLAALGENAFESTVVARLPELGGALAALKSAGALAARMTGSGSAVFGLFPSESAARVGARRASRLPGGFAVRVVRTLDRMPRPRRL